jgi:hypothetical protein
MNSPKRDELDYINFLIATQRVFTSTEVSRTHPAGDAAPAHDAYTRLLQRLPPDSEALWNKVKPLVKRTGGVLVVDDRTLDKPYAAEMALVARHWSGKYRWVMQGINLISLVWTNQTCRLPCDYRLYDKAQDGLSKNDHFRHMLQMPFGLISDGRLLRFAQLRKSYTYIQEKAYEKVCKALLLRRFEQVRFFIKIASWRAYPAK